MMEGNARLSCQTGTERISFLPVEYGVRNRPYVGASASPASPANSGCEHMQKPAVPAARHSSDRELLQHTKAICKCWFATNIRMYIRNESFCCTGCTSPLPYIGA